jgi:hypothetical protein
VLGGANISLVGGDGLQIGATDTEAAGQHPICSSPPLIIRQRVARLGEYTSGVESGQCGMETAKFSCDNHRVSYKFVAGRDVLFCGEHELSAWDLDDGERVQSIYLVCISKMFTE